MFEIYREVVFPVYIATFIMHHRLDMMARAWLISRNELNKDILKVKLNLADRIITSAVVAVMWPIVVPGAIVWGINGSKSN